MDSQRLLLSVFNNLVLILGIVIAIGLTILIIAFFISMLMPNKRDDDSSTFEQIDRMRLRDLEHDVDELKKRSEHK